MCIIKTPIKKFKKISCIWAFLKQNKKLCTYANFFFPICKFFGKKKLGIYVPPKKNYICIKIIEAGIDKCVRHPAELIIIHVISLHGKPQTAEAKVSPDLREAFPVLHLSPSPHKNQIHWQVTSCFLSAYKTISGLIVAF